MRIRIYADESVPVAVVAGLQRRGVSAISAREVGNLGISDPEQLTFASTNGFLLFTHDADFLRLAVEFMESGQAHRGFVYVHQERLGIGDCIRRLKEVVDAFSAEDMTNRVIFL